jgi:tetratricopeptide (TPR) repeat protein
MSHAAGAHQRLGQLEVLESIGRSMLGRCIEGNNEQDDATRAAAARISMSLRHAAKSSLADSLLNACEAGGSRPRPAAMAAAVHVARAYQALEAGDPASFVEHMQAAAIDYVSAGDPRRAAAQRGDVAYGHALLGAYEKAERALRDNLVEADRGGLRHIAAVAQNNLGMVLGRLGRLDEARAAESAAIEAFREQGNLRLEGGSRIYLAEILLRRGELEAAEHEAVSAVGLLDIAPPFRPYALATLARVLLARRGGGAPASLEALARANEAMAALDALGGSAEEGESIVRLVHAECVHASGAHDHARVMIAEARRRLLDRAGKISSEAARKGFLERVEEHARTLQLAADWARQRP